MTSPVETPEEGPVVNPPVPLQVSETRETGEGIEVTENPEDNAPPPPPAPPSNGTLVDEL